MKVTPDNVAPETSRADEATPVILPPLRPYEDPDTPAIALDILPEPDEFALPSESMTAEEIRYLARPIDMPPLRPDEVPDSAVTILAAQPDSRLDDPSWGTAGKAPAVSVRRDKQLHLWDEYPE